MKLKCSFTVGFMAYVDLKYMTLGVGAQQWGHRKVYSNKLPFVYSSLEVYLSVLIVLKSFVAENPMKKLNWATKQYLFNSKARCEKRNTINYS